MFCDLTIAVLLSAVLEVWSILRTGRLGSAGRSLSKGIRTPAQTKLCIELIFKILLQFHFEYFDYLVAGAGLLDDGPEGAGGGGGEVGGAAGLQALPALAADGPGGG